MEPKTITLPKTSSYVFEYSLLATSFLIPFLISGPQLLTGTVVNSLLFLFILQLRSRKVVPMIMLPSIGALLNGILFGKFTIFLLYFLPFIWVSNYVLIYSFKGLLKKYPLILSMAVSSFLKFVFLLSVAFIFSSMKLVPVIFMQLMGLFQLYTALLGGILALGIYAIIKKKP